MKPVVVYLYSSNRDSLARDVYFRIQKDKIEDFCRAKKWHIEATYREIYCASVKSRSEFLRMIEIIKAKGIDTIVIMSIESIGNLEELKAIVGEQFYQNNYKIYSVLDQKSYNLDFEEDNVTKKLMELEKKIKDIPSLPEVVTKVMDIVRDPKSSASELSRVISCDPGLTSRVLRLVNSAYYGFPRQISSIQQAIAMVGFTTVRGLVLSSSIFRIFTPKTSLEKTFDYKKFWKHSLMTSVAAKQISKFIYKNENEDMFSAAMLHDIGKIILDQYDHENYIQAFNESGDVFIDSSLDIERKYCFVAHTDIGYFVAQKWNLPQLLADSMLYHHDPMQMEEINPLVIIIYMANIFSNCELESVDVEFDIFRPELLSFIKLNKDDFCELKCIIKEVFDEVSEVEGFVDDTI